MIANQSSFSRGKKDDMGKEMKATTDIFLEVERQLTHILHVEMKPTFQYRLKR